MCWFAQHYKRASPKRTWPVILKFTSLELEITGGEEHGEEAHRCLHSAQDGHMQQRSQSSVTPAMGATGSEKLNENARARVDSVQVRRGAG